MIDKRNEVFSRIREAVKAEFPNASIEAEYVNEPAAFPHVSVEAIDMSPEYLDNTATEKYTRTVYEINIHSDKRSGAMTECYKIADIISVLLIGCNMVRTFGPRPLQNLANNSIKRLVLRFEGVADENYFYRR